MKGHLCGTPTVLGRTTWRAPPLNAPLSNRQWYVLFQTSSTGNGDWIARTNYDAKKRARHIMKLCTLVGISLFVLNGAPSCLRAADTVVQLKNAQEQSVGTATLSPSG